MDGEWVKGFEGWEDDYEYGRGIMGLGNGGYGMSMRRGV